MNPRSPSGVARWLRGLGIGLMAWLLVGFASAQEPRARSEYEVKAAVLYKVAKFIDWPQQTFANDSQSFVLCVVGDESVARAFASLDRKPLQRRSLNVRHMRGDTLDLRQCHAVFFARQSEQDIDYALRGLNEWPVLTVGETDDFATRGGVLTLIIANDKIQFKVNLPASKRAQLAMSSQLLQLATVIGEGKP
jgi:hypothetical protein